MRIGIIGVAGRMGRLLAQEAVAAGHTAWGTTRTPAVSDPLPLAPDLRSLAEGSDVVVDFTVAHAAARHAAAVAQTGTPFILGTSGLSAADESAVASAARDVPIVYSMNFSPGITLLLELAARMAAALPGSDYDAEIVETHHRQKVDAPSGTAVMLGRAVAEGRNVDLADVTQSGRDGHTGPRASGAIGFAAVRGGQVVGEHTLLFAGASEHLSLTHRAFDRRIFATGAIRAAVWVVTRPPGLYGMSDVIAPLPDAP